MKRNIISLSQAIEALAQYEEMHFISESFNLNNSVKISSKLNIYAYDAYIIDVAERLKSPLLSLDKKLNSTAKYYGIKIIGL